MQYKVTYIVGEKEREAVMNRRELDECRASYEVIEAAVISQ